MSPQVVSLLVSDHMPKWRGALPHANPMLFAKATTIQLSLLSFPPYNNHYGRRGGLSRWKKVSSQSDEDEDITAK